MFGALVNQYLSVDRISCMMYGDRSDATREKKEKKPSIEEKKAEKKKEKKAHEKQYLSHNF